MYISLYFYLKNVSNFNTLKLTSTNVDLAKRINFNLFTKNVFLSRYTSSQHISFNRDFDFLFKYNKRYHYSFNKNNSIHFKKLNMMLSNLFSKNNNVLILDSNYKSILPLYSYIFGLKTVYSNKNFFCIKKENITRDSWNYFYIKNIKKFNVNLLVVLDYFFFKKFLPIFKKFNLPILSLIPSNLSSVYVDYFVYINYCDLNVSKFFFFSFVSNLFFKYNLYFMNKYKHQYLYNLNNFLKKI